MANKKLNDHILSDKIKWILTGLCMILIFAMLLGLTLNAAGAFNALSYKTYIVEAEAARIDSETGEAFIDSKTASGGAYVGDIKSGDFLTFVFSADNAGKAEMSIRLASQYLKEASNWTPIVIGDCQLNKILDIELNGEELFVSDEVILEGGGESGGEPDADLWFNWKEVDLGEVSVRKGFNELTLSFKAHDYTDTAQPEYSGVFTANVDSLIVKTKDNPIEMVDQRTEGADSSEAA